MKKRRKKKWIYPKILYMCLAVLCVILVLISFKFSDQLSSVKTVVGNVMTPMQKGINTVGQFISDKLDLISSKQELLEENQN